MAAEIALRDPNGEARFRMTAFDLLLQGGSAVLPGHAAPVACDIAVSKGRIAAILAPGTEAVAAERVAVSGLVVMPGAIDAHLHLGHGKDIARPRVAADAAQESTAAAAGG